MHFIHLFIFYHFISRELIGSLRSLVLRHDSLKKSLKRDAAKFNISRLVFDNTVAPIALIRRDYLWFVKKLLNTGPWHEKRSNLKGSFCLVVMPKIQNGNYLKRISVLISPCDNFCTTTWQRSKPDLASKYSIYQADQRSFAMRIEVKALALLQFATISAALRLWLINQALCLNNIVKESRDIFYIIIAT